MVQRSIINERGDLIITTHYSLLLRVLRAVYPELVEGLRGSKLFAFFPFAALHLSRVLYKSTLVYAKRTQFAKYPNEHNLFINKALWKYTMFTDPRKQTQYEPNQTQFTPKTNPIRTQTNPIWSFFLCQIARSWKIYFDNMSKNRAVPVVCGLGLNFLPGDCVWL